MWEGTGLKVEECSNYFRNFMNKFYDFMKKLLLVDRVFICTELTRRVTVGLRHLLSTLQSEGFRL